MTTTTGRTHNGDKRGLRHRHVSGLYFVVCLFFLFFNLLTVIFRTTSNEDYNDGARDAYKRGPRERKETIEARLRLHDE